MAKYVKKKSLLHILHYTRFWIRIQIQKLMLGALNGYKLKLLLIHKLYNQKYVDTLIVHL